MPREARFGRKSVVQAPGHGDRSGMVTMGAPPRVRERGFRRGLTAGPTLGRAGRSATMRRAVAIGNRLSASFGANRARGSAG